VSKLALVGLTAALGGLCGSEKAEKNGKVEKKAERLNWKNGHNVGQRTFQV